MWWLASYDLARFIGSMTRDVQSGRVEKWVTEAATHGTVTVPEPSDWRGWLHEDQGSPPPRRLRAAASAGHRSPGRLGPAGSGCAPPPNSTRQAGHPASAAERQLPAKTIDPRQARAGSAERRVGAAALPN